MKTLVISRVQDTGRRAKIAEVIPDFLDWSFLDATDGHRPDLIDPMFAALLPDRIGSNDSIKPGAFGCFVSHYRAWQSCIALNQPILVLEDDATFNPHGMTALRQGLPDGFDLVFCNHRAVGWCTSALAELDPTASVLPLPVIIGRIVRSGVRPEKAAAPGSDCYLISPHAARNLVSQADRVRAVMGVDWFLVACGLGPDTPSSAWQGPARVARMVQNPSPIRSGIATTWAVATGIHLSGPSVIQHKTEVAISDYRHAILRPMLTS